jgi:hypothetical protein
VQNLSDCQDRLGTNRRKVEHRLVPHTDSDPAKAGSSYWCGKSVFSVPLCSQTRMFAKTGSEKLEKTRLYRCGEYCAGGGAGQDSAMSKTGWLGLPLGVTFNRSSAVYARMQGWKSPTAGEMREALERVFSMQLPFVFPANVSNRSFAKAGWLGSKHQQEEVDTVKEAGSSSGHRGNCSRLDGLELVYEHVRDHGGRPASRKPFV